MDNLSQILRLQSQLLLAAVKDSSLSIDYLTDYFMAFEPGKENFVDEEKFMDVIARFQFYDRLAQRIEVVVRVLEQVAENAEQNGEIVMIDEIDAAALIHKVESLFDSATVEEIFVKHGFSDKAKECQAQSSSVKTTTRIELF